MNPSFENEKNARGTPGGSGAPAGGPGALQSAMTENNCSSTFQRQAGPWKRQGLHYRRGARLSQKRKALHHRSTKNVNACRMQPLVQWLLWRNCSDSDEERMSGPYQWLRLKSRL